MNHASFYLMSLPEGYRERALAKNLSARPRINFRGALLNFDWESSTEGNDFWGDVYLHLFDRECRDNDGYTVRPLPKLPT